MSGRCNYATDAGLARFRLSPIRPTLSWAKPTPPAS